MVKRMLQRFYPKHYVDSTYQIDFRKLYEKGYRGILFDIDNTLVEHGKDATKEAISLFQSLKEIGYTYCLISNNKEERVKRFNQEIQAEYIFKANKPFVKNYYKAMELMKTNSKNTIFVGDQLFTDVWGANKVGMETFLVKPIDPKEEIQIVLKRYLERIVLHFYLKNSKRKNV